MTCVFVCPEDECKRKLARALVHCTAHCAPGKLTKACVEQWRIQDFPEVGTPTLWVGVGGGGVPTYDFAKFSQKLHEIERILTPREGGVPLRSANVELSTKQISVKVTPTTGEYLISGDMLASYPKNLKRSTPKL